MLYAVLPRITIQTLTHFIEASKAAHQLCDNRYFLVGGLLEPVT